MQTIDIIIMIILGVFMLLGGLKGLVGQMSLILSILAGGLCWLFFGDWMLGVVEGWFEQSWLASILAGMLSFLCGLMLVWIIQAVARKYVKDGSAKNLDTFLGVGFGAFKGLIIAALLVAFVGGLGKPEMIQKAFVAPRIFAITMWIGHKAGFAQLADSVGEKAADTVMERVTKEDILKAVRAWGIDKALLGGSDEKKNTTEGEGNPAGGGE